VEILKSGVINQMSPWKAVSDLGLCFLNNIKWQWLVYLNISVIYFFIIFYSKPVSPTILNLAMKGLINNIEKKKVLD